MENALSIRAEKRLKERDQQQPKTKPNGLISNGNGTTGLRRKELPKKASSLAEEMMRACQVASQDQPTQVFLSD